MEQLSPRDIHELAILCPGGVAQHVNLATISRWRIGGSADLVLRPTSTSQVAALLEWFAQREIRPVVIGLTSNLLFDDAGLRAPCIQIGERMAKFNIDGLYVRAQAGIWVPRLAHRLMHTGLGGAEHICGIPGTLGGLIFMNGGSQRKGISTAVVEVESVDTTGIIRHRNALDCSFNYRRSVFKENGEVITSVELQFVRREPDEIRKEMRRILADRRRKFPRKEPNCGSVFKSDPAMYAEIGPPGAAIERLGLKGKKIGGAQVSPIHANFITNTGNATAVDVLTLIGDISNAIEKNTGFRMEAEVVFVNEAGHFLTID